MTEETLTFDLDFKEIPVKIAGEDYVLVELDGKQRDTYLNTLTGKLTIDKNGKGNGVKNFDGLQASLLTASLKKVVDGEYVAVSMATIQSWPSRVQGALYDKARELSALDTKKSKSEEDEDDEGFEKNG